MTARDRARGERGPRTDAGTGTDAIPWHRREWTTIVLETVGEDWRATQTGVDVEGRGETAAAAAADYCRRIDALGDGGEGDG